ncbi:hypothetical protein SDC9_65086 [bioreactor metagenome]|uniref:Uncharacterized protein n=1 Tax=bioreactor metagenome TaxID=1076179 RepID=A0A644XWK5_9ZZZZ
MAGLCEVVIPDIVGIARRDRFVQSVLIVVVEGFVRDAKNRRVAVFFLIGL